MEENRSSMFTLNEKASASLKELLHQTTYGTEGACYRHLDTLERIEGLDNPLHLSLERNKKVLGNCTFCRREGDWYIRFFTFNIHYSSSGKLKSKAKKSKLKEELTVFFNSALEKGINSELVSSFYAYIEPKNKRSIQMSENFGFKKIATVLTQTFSRVKPKKSNRLVKIDSWKEVQLLFEKKYKNYSYYFETYLKEGPFYGLKNEAGELLTLCKYNEATWEIVRLPGKMGGLLTKVIPLIPILNKIIKPKKHTFIVPEAVWVKENNAFLLEEFFSALLFEKKKTLILWWIDQKDELFQFVQKKINWGLLHKLVGKTEVNVMRKSNQKWNENLIHYVSCKDMI
ncbi:MAG: hypothetical protein HYR91_02590 [Flavobacteriia bacterium]|nr:hypothetical protein [Flavobacteriia bacterium]